MSNNIKKVLVTGATGMQGGAVVQALLRGGHSVTGFVRNPEAPAARALAEQGVALAVGNLEDLASLEAASEGHDAVFSVQLFGADMADLGSEERQARNIATAARRAGVRQIVHTSVSGTGWKARFPHYEQGELLATYWTQKEAAEAAVREAGVDRWTILKPAYYMDNLLPGHREDMHPDLHQASGGTLTASTIPQTGIALINANDFGAAVAAAVADPDTFHEAEIELAGDVATYTEMAAAISAVANRTITVVHAPPHEFELVRGAAHEGRTLDDLVGYPARRHHAARYGLTTTTLQQWAAQQDWRLPKA
ncbi:NmrA family NAD(P)-binding protein [Aeromicrobium alkaliterrae]|uniref:NmrA/HSCARG family protein n=1 Tax=Aeromicrobium alkaliterrae TaxID=302168 RepID=A0ABP4W6V4_9ACTN